MHAGDRPVQRQQPYDTATSAKGWILRLLPNKTKSQLDGQQMHSAFFHHSRSAWSKDGRYVGRNGRIYIFGILLQLNGGGKLQVQDISD